MVDNLCEEFLRFVFLTRILQVRAGHGRSWWGPPGLHCGAREESGVSPLFFRLPEKSPLGANMGLETEILRYIEVLHREKDIDKEILFEALEEALAAAIRRKYDLDEEVVEVHIDRETGKVQSDFELDLADLGRIAATTAKQRLLQKLREAERDVLYEDFESRMGTLANGTVQRFEGDNVVISIGKVEGILPRKERVRGENYHVGDRIRCLVREVRKFGPKIKVVLSRANPDLVRRLFELEVPEIADGIIEIKSVEREPGYRTKLGVLSHDPKIDCVGACVGVRGTR
ncbi:MAG TPA: transcription termination/antitermination protein NusA, partial [Planctomycetes bacterium]|nr:transcription termination/antitermination protein NusA [Planctomycetota bacterium]